MANPISSLFQAQNMLSTQSQLESLAYGQQAYAQNKEQESYNQYMATLSSSGFSGGFVSSSAPYITPMTSMYAGMASINLSTLYYGPGATTIPSPPTPIGGIEKDTTSNGPTIGDWQIYKKAVLKALANGWKNSVCDWKNLTDDEWKYQTVSKMCYKFIFDHDFMKALCKGIYGHIQVLQHIISSSNPFDSLKQYV